MTRGRILEAASSEVERHGVTQFRVKRVAAAAGTSVALLYSYFADREDLIAAAVVDRFHRVLRAQAEIFTAPFVGVTTAEGLRAALERVIDEAQAPELAAARLSRAESMAFAEHNPAAAQGLARATHEVGQFILSRVSPLAERGLLAPGVSAAAFARVWYALFFGQIALAGEHALTIPREEWLAALRRLAGALVAG